MIFHNDELAGRTILIQRTIVPIGRTQSGLAASIVTPSPKKTDGNGDRSVDDEPFIDKRKPSSTTAVIGVLSNGPSQKKWMETATKSLIRATEGVRAYP